MAVNLTGVTQGFLLLNHPFPSYATTMSTAAASLAFNGTPRRSVTTGNVFSDLQNWVSVWGVEATWIHDLFVNSWCSLSLWLLRKP